MNFRLLISMGVAAAIKLLCGFILLKWTAVSLGAEAIPILGQILSVVALIGMMSNGGIQRGITVIISKKADSGENAAEISWTLTALLLITGVVISTSLFLFYLFNIGEYLGLRENSWIFIIMIFGHVFYGLNNNLIAVTSGFSRAILIAKSNSIGFLAALVASISLTHYFGIEGLITSITAYGFIYFLASSFFLRKYLKYVISFKRDQINYKVVKDLLEHSLVLIIASFSLQVSVIFCRSLVIDASEIKDAAIWEIVFRVSDGYLQFFGMIYVFHFLPRFVQSKISRFDELRFIVPVLLIIFIVVFYFGEWIYTFLISEVVSEAPNYALIILIGDFFRLIFISEQYRSLAKDNKREYALFELAQAITMYFCIYVSYMAMGYKGFYYGYVLAFASMWALKILYSKLKAMKSRA